MLIINSLGHVTVTLGDRHLTEILSKKSLGLLLYLSLHSEQPIYRHHAANLFWDGFEISAAGNNLRHALWQIRKELDEDANCLHSPSRELITLDGDSFKSDVRRFKRLAHSPRLSDWDDAATLYQGDFLSDFYIPDAPLFNEWVLSERESLQKMYFDLQHRRARQYESLGDERKSAFALESLLRIDPLNESAYESLIRLKIAYGHRAAAVNLFRKIKALLRKDLNISPSASLKLLYRDLMEDKTPVSRPQPIPVASGTPSNDNRMDLFVSSDPNELFRYRQQLIDGTSEGQLVLDIANFPGMRIPFEGIYELIDEVEKISDENLRDAIEDIRTLRGIDAYHLYSQLLSIFEQLPRAITLRIWHLHFLDDHTIDLIGFLFRRLRTNQLVILGLYDRSMASERIETFIRAHRVLENFSCTGIPTLSE